MTDYYVRKITSKLTDSFIYDLNEHSDNAVLFTEADSVYLKVNQSFLDTSVDFNIYTYLVFKDINMATQKGSIVAGDVRSLLFNGNPFSMGGTHGAPDYWSTTLGWANPQTSYSTWVGELAQAFEDFKNDGTVSYPDRWGVDNGEINMLVFETYYDTPTYIGPHWVSSGVYEPHYNVLFYKGNSAYADSIVEITKNE